jgi:DNA-binding NtrC family response regulator
VLSVLLVDDDPCLLNVCERFPEKRPDISVSAASSVENALQLLKYPPFDLIVTGYLVPGTNGIGF